MKRDLDLIRDILLYIEEAEQYPVYSDTIEIPEATEEMISFHVQLLADAGYIDYLDATACGNEGLVCYYINRLTMAGCDYLDGVRDDGAKSVSDFLIYSDSATIALLNAASRSFIAARRGSLYRQSSI